jgi:hypothetical protein
MPYKITEKCDRCSRETEITGDETAAKAADALAAKRTENVAVIAKYLKDNFLPEELPEFFSVTDGKLLAYGSLCQPEAGAAAETTEAKRHCLTRVENALVGLKPVDTKAGARARKAKKDAAPKAEEKPKTGETPPSDIASNLGVEGAPATNDAPVEPPPAA